MSQRTGFFWLPHVVCGCRWVPETKDIGGMQFQATCLNPNCSNFKIPWILELEQVYGYPAPIIPS